VDYGDERRDERRGHDQEEEGECGEELRHGFGSRFRSVGLGPESDDASRPACVMLLFSQCGHVPPGARLLIGRFSSPEGGSSIVDGGAETSLRAGAAGVR
jgi:hypothetical protein